MSNQHIFEYLDYYVDLPQPPHYAVMVTGPWGIGKSYNIKQYLRILEKRGKKVAYVSLYGIKSSDEIAVALWAALLPKQDSKLVKLGGQLGRALWKKLPFSEVAGGSAAWIPESLCDLIVLDDLERAAMSPVEVLGFANAFIEHEERRVVIVANENEVLNQADYRRIREKVIGMTFEFVEQSGDALAHFISRTQDETTRTFFNTVTDTILAIFAQSKTQNLRILDQSLRSWERVHQAIDPELRTKEKGLVAAFKLFLALSLELKAGRIGREDLSDRVSRIARGTTSKHEGKGEQGTPLSQAQDRYGRLHLHDSVLSDDVLIQVLCDGRIDPSAINASLSVYELFVEPEEEPAWRKVWHGFLREAQEFEDAFEVLEKEFAERVYDGAGLVLHVMGLRLWGAEIGQLARSEDEIITECKAYVDDLKRAGRLPRYRPDGLRDAAYGLQFHNAQTPAFQELHAYYTEQSELAYQDTWPDLARSLLADMSGDGEKFYQRICWSTGKSQPDCAEDPILCNITPALFVDKLQSCTPEAQRTILEGLKDRYDAGRLGRSLAAESTWIIGIVEELRRRIPQLVPIRRYSLSKETERLLGSAFREAKDLLRCLPPAAARAEAAEVHADVPRRTASRPAPTRGQQ